MIKIFVDSGSSIKSHELQKYGVGFLPLKVYLKGVEYDDGINLPYDDFYKALIEEKLFPKTSLPSMADAEQKVLEYTNAGYDVLIITISSGLSGTYNAMRQFFAGNEKVRVIDSKTAVGGVRILVEEMNKHLDDTLDEAEARLNAIIPKIRVVAIPETLEYLHRGGRLSRAAWIFGSILQLKPLLQLGGADGKVLVIGKERGKVRAMKALAAYLNEMRCDENYPIIPSYTYSSRNLDELLSFTDEKFKAQMAERDDLDPAIACHWGPGAFGYIFVAK